MSRRVTTLRALQGTPGLRMPKRRDDRSQAARVQPAKDRRSSWLLRRVGRPARSEEERTGQVRPQEEYALARVVPARFPDTVEGNRVPFEEAQLPLLDTRAATLLCSPSWSKPSGQAISEPVFDTQREQASRKYCRTPGQRGAPEQVTILVDRFLCDHVRPQRKHITGPNGRN